MIEINHEVSNLKGVGPLLQEKLNSQNISIIEDLLFLLPLKYEDRTQLFDLENDPDEFKDLGQSTKHSKTRDEMKELLLQRLVSRKNRVAATDEFVLKDRDYTKEDGIMIGVW